MAFAQGEAEIVRAALPSQAATLVQTHELSARGLMAALEKKHAWVHVAAHGQTRAGLQGYSGLWLPSSRDGEPDQFLSWMSLVSQPVGADLLVLNACETASTDLARTGVATNFAEALSAAGVDDVVASRWSLSESASRVWLPPFYAEIGKHGIAGTSASLRDAQLALRESRHFRHPFYWASITHFSRGFPKHHRQSQVAPTTAR
jgi:CHAT domain-containing protein